MPSFSGEEHPGNMGFILSGLYQELNRLLGLSGTQPVNLDLIALGIAEVGSFATQDDKTFGKEWLGLQQARAKIPGYEPGEEGWEQTDLSFRLREIGCITRSLCGQGVLTKVAAAAKPYVPKQRSVEVMA